MEFPFAPASNLDEVRQRLRQADEWRQQLADAHPEPDSPWDQSAWNAWFYAGGYGDAVRETFGALGIPLAESGSGGELGSARPAVVGGFEPA